MLLLPLLEIEAGERPPCDERGMACTAAAQGGGAWRAVARHAGQGARADEAGCCSATTER